MGFAEKELQEVWGQLDKNGDGSLDKGEVSRGFGLNGEKDEEEEQFYDDYEDGFEEEAAFGKKPLERGKSISRRVSRKVSRKNSDIEKPFK